MGWLMADWLGTILQKLWPGRMSCSKARCIPVSSRCTRRTGRSSLWWVCAGCADQTVVLLRQYEQMKGNYSSAWMLWGNAVKWVSSELLMTG